MKDGRITIMAISIMEIMGITLVARVRWRDDRPPSRKNQKYLFLANREKQGILVSTSENIYSWLLGTLTGLRDGVRRLVA